MRSLFLPYQRFLWVLLLAAACKEKLALKMSDEGLSSNDFFGLVETLNPPLTIHEEELLKPVSDSDKVHTATFASFLPDSVFQAITDKKEKVVIGVEGKIIAPDKSVYLIIKVISGKQRRMSVLYFDKKRQYLGRLTLLDSKHKIRNVHHSCKIDARMNISLITEKKSSTGQVWTGEQIYYFDATGLPIMAVTNTNEDLSNQIRGNPIDSFPSTQKYTGDYSSDEKNLVSIRDGITGKSINFFMHISKQQGKCVAELKGEAEMVSRNKAIFRDNKTPCVIEFNFSSNTLHIKEMTGCGTYRDIGCVIEGKYPKKKK
jgi:hypothetical protein